jgi:competence ComEA-like helix-hairpin-helix protein
MEISKQEKAIFMVVLLLLILGFGVLTVRVVNARGLCIKLQRVIDEVGLLTDKEPLQKGVYFDLAANKEKLNLNRTDLKSIRAIPGMTAALAKAIYNFVRVKNRGEVSELTELLKIKGFTKKHLDRFSPYMTVQGGHAGFAAWGERLNLNFAREEDLSALPGISKALAKSIVEYRDAQGSFTYVEELLNVKGMTKGSLNKIIGLVSIQ